VRFVAAYFNDFTPPETCLGGENAAPIIETLQNRRSMTLRRKRGFDRGADRDVLLMMSGGLKFCNVLALSAPQTTITAQGSADGALRVSAQGVFR